MKTKLKPVLPSLREKKRYMVFEVISKGKITDFRAVRDAIMESAQRLLGQLGMAKAGIIPMENKWSPELQRGIIRVGHRHADELRASLMLTSKINDEDIIVKSIGVSGIIKKAENNYLKKRDDKTSTTKIMQGGKE